MRRKINRQLILTSLFATMVTMILMLLLFWQLFEQQVFEDLKAYTQLLETTKLYQSEKTYQAKLKECEAQIKAWQQRINYLNSGNFKYPLKYTGSDYNPVFERISSVFNNEADLATQLDTFEKDNLIK